MPDSRYIPALSFRWLTPFYDSLLRWGMQEARFKHRLIHQADIQPGDHVLDLGCGTGTLTLQIKQLRPLSHATGLDGDPEVLAIAQRKAKTTGAAVAWVRGMAFALPHPANSFERVVTSLVLHHLTTENKQKTLAEVYRVLRPGGQFHVVDFGPPRSAQAKRIAPLLRRLEEVADNFDGRLPQMFGEAGFNAIEETARFATVMGDLALYRMAKPLPIAAS